MREGGGTHIEHTLAKALLPGRRLCVCCLRPALAPSRGVGSTDGKHQWEAYMPIVTIEELSQLRPVENNI